MSTTRLQSMSRLSCEAYALGLGEVIQIGDIEYGPWFRERLAKELLYYDGKFQSQISTVLDDQESLRRMVDQVWETLLPEERSRFYDAAEGLLELLRGLGALNEKVYLETPGTILARRKDESVG